MEPMSELETRIREIIREEIAIALAAWKPELAEGFLDTETAAAYASVSIATIRRWVRERRLPEHRAGRRVRVKRSDLEQLLATPRGRHVADEDDVIEEFVRSELARKRTKQPRRLSQQRG